MLLNAAYAVYTVCVTCACEWDSLPENVSVKKENI